MHVNVTKHCKLLLASLTHRRTRSRCFFPSVTIQLMTTGSLSQLVVCVLLVLATATLSVRSAELENEDSASLYYISTLIPGQSSIPPQFTLSLDHVSGVADLRPLNGSWIERAAQRVAGGLNVIADRVPSDRRDLCHFTHIPDVFSLAATVQPEGTLVTCNAGVLTRFLPRTLSSVGEFHQSGDPLPLAVLSGGECTRVPFSLIAVDTYVLKPGHMVAVLELRDESRPLELSTCTAWFELRQTEEGEEKLTKKSVFAPVLMLVLMIALRTLPRYVLTRQGQVDRDSYRGQAPKLSAARLAELKRQQLEIIAKMKEEDAREGRLKKNE